MPLVSTKEMLRKAYEGGYAIGAFNVNNMEIIQGITNACKKMNSPVIMQASAGAIAYAGPANLVSMVKIAAEETGLPIALNLDHGPDFETCKACIDNGFTSVMIDGSALPYEENVALAKKVADYAHQFGVSVEAELGQLAGIEDDVVVSEDEAHFTDPDQAVDFVKRTGVDSLAIAIGTSHGAYKFKPGQKPELRFDILEEIGNKLPGFPIVLHGASAVVPKYLQMVNEFGGAMEDAIGIPEDMLRKASSMAVCKINVDSDLRLAMTGAIRKHFAEYPDHFDPRQYLGDGRDAVSDVVETKIQNILGSANKA